MIEGAVKDRRMLDERQSNADLSFGDFRIDRADERLIGPAGPVRLGRKAFRLITELAELEGKLLTKDALFSSVWDGTIVSEAALTSVIKELRRALSDDPRAPSYIETVYGRGYRLIPAVTRGGGTAAPAPPPAPAGPATSPALKLGAPPILIVSGFSGSGAANGESDLPAQIREEVLSGLARFRELQLIADARSDHDPAGLDGRAYRLTAMVVPQEGGTKVMARLQRLADRVVVWTDSIAVAGASMGAGVELIVRRIVGAALPVVDEDMFLELPGNAESVYGAYLAAKWSSFHARTHPQALDAARALERIIAEHPRFALAYPPLVRLYNTDYGYTGLGSTGRAERARALQLAKSGLAADRGNAHAHSVLGFCHLWNGDLPLARTCFERSLQLNPYSHMRVQEAATGFMYMGDSAAARSLMDRAAELNPIADDNLLEDMGRLLLIEGEYGEAHHHLRSLADGSIWADMYLAICEMRLGLAGGRERMATWREAVALRWKGDGPPTDEELVDWIMFHHPFPAPRAESIAADITATLAGETSNARASR